MQYLKLGTLLILLAMTQQPLAATITTDPALSDSYQIVRVSDVIDSGDAERLEQVLHQASTSGKPLMIHMDSRGGDVDVSMAMGRIIRQYQATTTHGYCASSCVFAFLGGSQRLMSNNSGAMLYVHRPELAEAYVANPTAFGKQMLDMLRDYIVSMTGSAALYDTMMTIPFSNPRTLCYNEAQSMNVVTQ